MQNAGPDSDEIFMLRAIELAAMGMGQVSPNPLVGCVIVHNGRIIGEGWHAKFRGPHAEVMAINAVTDRSLLAESTAYVSLEPCSHFGKTPPCADLIVSSGIRRVVLAMKDPNPLVAGSGVEKLSNHGITTAVGVLERQAREMNRRFITWMEKRRPFLILKWAETRDGFMARADGSAAWISHPLSRQLVHRWRTEEDAILVGTHTAKQDNPQLNVRLWSGRDPARIVIDRRLELSSTLHLFDGSQRTICYNTVRDDRRPNLEFIKLEGASFLQAIIDDLYRRDIQSVIIEGGSRTLAKFIDSGLWDEARVFTSEKTFGAGIKSPAIPGVLHAQQEIETDVLRIYKPM